MSLLSLMLHSGNGPQYSSLAMADFIESWDAIHLFTPRGSSPFNRRAERVHMYLNGYLLSQDSSGHLDDVSGVLTRRRGDLEEADMLWSAVGSHGCRYRLAR
ncbi:hypothetical protein FOZ62_015466, partial [Perkinsus olseni]